MNNHETVQETGPVVRIHQYLCKNPWGYHVLAKETRGVGRNDPHLVAVANKILNVMHDKDRPLWDLLDERFPGGAHQMNPGGVKAIFVADAVLCFIESFKSAMGSTVTLKSLVGADLSTQSGQKKVPVRVRDLGVVFSSSSR